MAASSAATAPPKKFLSQAEAQKLDQLLMGEEGGYTLEQLMELAGLSCAVAIVKEYGVVTDGSVVVLCGPGNNGGDGLVLARHLVQFGFSDVQIVYPVAGKNPHFSKLLKQVENHKIPVLTDLPDLAPCRLVVDALFGFSFRPPLRGQFLDIAEKVNKSCTPVASVDIPSGWDVESGPPDGTVSFTNVKLLVSLTCPKSCSARFGGVHYLGGRFIPRTFKEYGYFPYPSGTELVIKL